MPDVRDKEILRDAVDFIGRVLVPSGLLVGVLYYFGYTRERALFSYFGVPLGTLDFTTTDYLVRSAPVVFAPLATLLLTGLVVVAAHQLVVLRLRRHRRWWRVGWAAGGLAGLTLLALGLLGIHRPWLVLGPVDSALALGVGAALLDYSAWMLTTGRTVPATVARDVRRTQLARHVMLLGLVVVAAFWWTLNVANSNGLRSARAIESSLQLRGEAVIVSRERLRISGHGVRVEELPADAAGPAFRYRGLRVLLHTGERWLLVPTGWTRTNGDSVVVLRDDVEGVRVDVRP